VASLWRVVVDWSGGKIGTGFSNLYFTGGVSTPQICADSVRTFFSSAYNANTSLPTGITISFRSTVDVVEETDGSLANQLPVTAPGSLTGADSKVYAALAGSCVTWRTADFHNGRRVRGRTFLVPLGGNALQSDETIDNTQLGFINTAAASLVSAAPELVVWRRPTAVGATDGTHSVVISGTSADRACYLTSRR
jgi:hypothetical protein